MTQKPEEDGDEEIIMERDRSGHVIYDHVAEARFYAGGEMENADGGEFAKVVDIHDSRYNFISDGRKLFSMEYQHEAEEACENINKAHRQAVRAEVGKALERSAKTAKDYTYHHISWAQQQDGIVNAIRSLAQEILKEEEESNG